MVPKSRIGSCSSALINLRHSLNEELRGEVTTHVGPVTVWVILPTAQTFHGGLHMNYKHWQLEVHVHVMYTTKARPRGALIRIESNHAHEHIHVQSCKCPIFVHNTNNCVLCLKSVLHLWAKALTCKCQCTCTSI